MKQTRIAVVDDSLSVRIETDKDGKRYFIGYAAVYNSPSRIIAERGRVFNEVLEPGCFDRVLNDVTKDIVLTLDHNHFYNLGRTTSGNLQIQSDEIGLRFRALVPDTTLGRDTEEMIKRGDYTDCSFCFSVEDSGESWVMGIDRKLIHNVKEVSGLYDLAICTLRGAYAATVIDLERVSRKFEELEGGLTTQEEKNDVDRNIRQQQYRKIVTNSLKG
jgi:HK97 family phage prohead protease